MADWLASMQQTFEYYTVDPGTWKDVKLIDNVKSCTITRESDVETLGSATIDVTGVVGESYIRIYLITIQNGVKERHPLGTFLVQTPSSSFDGKIRTVTMDAYTPLIELKENPPPIGYSIFKGENQNNNPYVLDNAYRLARENARAPVVSTMSDAKVLSDFVANTDDTWLTFISDLLATADYSLELDEMGRILFAPYQDTESMQPIWTYDDSNSSILYPDIDIDHDLFGIPNVIEIISSNGFYNEETKKTEYYLRVENNDESSPISIANRGRTLTYRDVDPVIVGDTNTILTKSVVLNYAEKLLKSMSSVEYTVSYKHSYCPVRLGDCVRLNYNRAGLTNIKAKVISQSIKCEPGCPVSEKAVFSAKLWR